MHDFTALRNQIERLESEQKASSTLARLRWRARLSSFSTYPVLLSSSPFSLVCPKA
jgi:hypothetical protein